VFIASPFNEELQQHSLRNGTDVPHLVIACIAEVERRGMDCIGIYRLSGNSTSIQELKRVFNEQMDLNLDQTIWANEDISIITGTLKLYFRELSIPLTTFEYYDSFISAVQIIDYNERLMSIKNIVYQLPPAYYATLKFLMYHLARVAALVELNKMDSSNLAIVFGPTLMRSRDPTAHIVNMGFQNAVIESMISQAEWMFEEPT
jgi:hypothetical protein